MGIEVWSFKRQINPQLYTVISGQFPKIYSLLCSTIEKPRFCDIISSSKPTIEPEKKPKMVQDKLMDHMTTTCRAYHLCVRCSAKSAILIILLSKLK